MDGGSGNDAMYGGAGDDSVYGGAGNDAIFGGAGNNTFSGGLGDDQFSIDGNDTIIEGVDGGNDTVVTTVSVTLSDNVENIYMTGSDGISGTGNTLNNAIYGNSAANTLNGGTGSDTLKGFDGNDIYVTDGNDTITEYTNSGTDTVQSSVTYTLGDNLEYLTLTGSLAINGTGNALSNSLTGNSAANTLDGGTGKDTLIGGDGDDTYVTDGNDTITEASDQGTDTVQSAITYTLGSNLEHLTLTGSSAINGTGNALNNGLIGNEAANTLNGGTGSDTLNGGTDSDALIGGSGDDTYVTDGNDTITEGTDEGTDLVQSSVTYSLGSNVENLTLTGSSAINGTGNALANTITGNAVANTLDGGTGNDTLIGGSGNDTYMTDGNDTITEAADGGTDTVQIAITYTLGANLENLTLTGSSAINGTGNALSNSLTGNSAANTLNGGTGSDTLIGGSGDDIYVTDGNDTITESSDGGTDTVQSSVTSILGSNLENLTLTGSSAINGTGNAQNNTVIGNSAANTLNGGTGSDTLIGGLGNDTYVTDGNDTITEGTDGGTDTVQSAITYTLGANLENLTLTEPLAINGTGNALANTITGNSVANTLDGGTGNDTLIGGKGDDIYVTDGNDTITEGTDGGTDTVQSAITYTLGANLENLTLTGTLAINGTGNALSNTITGNAVANTLNGGTGSDTLIGGDGNDTYVTDGNDTITEASDQGTDTVQSSVTYFLASNLENLTLTGSSAINGTGNALANTITGNGASNTLDGGTGNDTLIGGYGNDTYVTDGNDTITEATNAGVDTVQSSVTYTLGDNLENLALTGSDGINGTGNTLNNTLTGNSGSNTLNGGTGTDILIGGSGDDTYVTDGNETITEGTDGGTDTVLSSVTYTLGSNLDNLTLTGSSSINGTGNALDNTITGNAGNNLLFGGAGSDVLWAATGNDTLSGGEGSDAFIIDGNDVITEGTNAGTDDSVYSSVSYTLGANLEHLVLIGVDSFGELDLTSVAALNGTGNTLNNIILGNLGANILIGNSGNDTLYGSEGADRIIGGAGRDELYGKGPGLYGDDLTVGDGDVDTFVFNSAAESKSYKYDTVMDFEVGIDKIDISAIDANSAITADQAFVFSTQADSSNAVWIEESDGNSMVYADYNGDEIADFGLLLASVTGVTAADFIL